MSACGTEAVQEPVEESQLYLIGGSYADPASPVVLLVFGSNTCTGTLLDAKTILTAGHCLPESERATLSVESADPGRRCLTPNAGSPTCGVAEFRVERARDIDVGLVVATNQLITAEQEQSLVYPELSASLPRRFYGIGYASPSGESVTSELLVQGNFMATFRSSNSLVARSSSLVCSGDSGMGAFTRTQQGRLVLHGVLTSSEASAADPRCTEPGQFQHWAAGDALQAFVTAARSGEEQRGDSNPTVASETLEAAASRFGSRLLSLSAHPPRKGEIPPEEGAISVGIVSGNVHGSAWIRRDTSALEELSVVASTTESVAEPGGLEPTTTLVPRWGISNDIDTRSEYLVNEVGRVMAGGRCTGALQGVRLVRTAAHCIVGQSSWPTFQLMYHGGARTVSYDGGATWVTHAAKSAQTFYYGGHWDSKDCQATRFDKSYEHHVDCLQEDWAIMVMPSNVWTDINVVPRYMGYAKARVGSAKNTGYPSCADVNSVNVPSCVSGRMYGQSSCTMHVVQRSGGVQWNSCDSTPGHSGSPLFYSSGGGNYLIGNDSARDANQCPNKQCPAAGPGNNQWLTDFTGQLRTQYSAYSL